MDEYIKKMAQSKPKRFTKQIFQYAKKHKFKFGIGVIVLVIFSSAVLKGSPGVDEVQAVLRQVSVIELNDILNDGGSIPLVGELRANQQLDLRPQISGQVSKVHVKVGQQVTAGQVLIELNHADYDASVAQASASLQSAMASLAKMQNGARSEDIIIAQQSVDAAKQQLLDMQNGGRPEEVAQAELAVNSAKLAIDDALINYNQTKTQAGNVSTNTLQNAVQAIQGAQFSVDQVLEQDLVTLFPEPADYRFQATLTDTAIENEINSLRRTIETNLDLWRNSTKNLQADLKFVVLPAIEKAIAEMNGVLSFLDKTGDALDEADPTANFDSNQISAMIATVNSNRSSIKSQIDGLYNHKQGVQNSDITNEKSLEVAQTQIDNAQTAYQKAIEQLKIVKEGATVGQIAIQQTQLRQAEQQLLIAQNGARPEDLRLQQASVAQARASLALASAQRAKAIITAPISGQVTYNPLKISDIVSQSTIAISLANDSALEVNTFVSEDERAFIAVGNEVLIEEKYKGVVREIAPALDPINKKIEIKVTVTEEAPLLTLGETVRLEVSKTLTDGVSFKVPLATVRLRSSGAEVFLVNRDGLLEELAVEVGDVTANKIEILTSLPENARIVEDARGLKAGQEVVIK